MPDANGRPSRATTPPPPPLADGERVVPIDFTEIEAEMLRDAEAGALGPDEEAGRFVRFRDSFVIRSADMTWRARFHIIPTKFIEQPYGVVFSNPMGSDALELKHHEEAPLVLIGAGGQASRAIPHGHRLELRDARGSSRVAVEVHLPDQED